MMDPQSGNMQLLTYLEAEEYRRNPEKLKQAVAEKMAATGDIIGPATAFALFREGETIEIRGCSFMVKGIRRHRVTLIPVPKPSATE